MGCFVNAKKIQLFLILSLGAVIVVSASLEAGWWDKVKSTVTSAYNVVEDQASKAKKSAEAQAKKIKDIGDTVSSVGGAVVDVGVKIGNITVKEMSKVGGEVVDLGGKIGKVALKAGDVVVDGVSKAGAVVVKVGQSVVNASGMVLLNVGGILWALTKGDFEQFADCGKAVYSGAKLGIATVVDEVVKAVQPLDLIAKIDSLSIEASAAELSLQGKTPKVSIKGRFWGRDFELKDVQIDLSNPEKLVTDLAERLIKLKLG